VGELSSPTHFYTKQYNTKQYKKGHYMVKEKLCTFDELVTSQTLAIHSTLLEGGGKSMKAAVHWAMVSVLNWRAEKDQEEKDSGK
jgi:hypothetical protein